MNIILKIFVALGLLFESHRALGLIDNQNQVTLSLHTPLLSVNVSVSGKWVKGVYECHDGCAEVLNKFTGATFHIGKTVIKSFKTYVDELGGLTKCNSTFLSMRCTETLETLSLLNKLGKSPSYLIFQLSQAMPNVSTEFRNIVTNLASSIGELVDPVNEVITLTEKSIMKTLTQFLNRFTERTQDRCEKIDFEEAFESVQLFTNTVALIAKTALTDCGCVTFANEAYEAASTLVFVLYLYLIAVQGSHANIVTVLTAESTPISHSLNLCFEAMDPLIGGLAKAITGITFDVAKSMREFLMYFVKLTEAFNDALGIVIGPFQGVKIVVEQIKSNLVRSQGN